MPYAVHRISTLPFLPPLLLLQVTKEVMLGGGFRLCTSSQTSVTLPEWRQKRIRERQTCQVMLLEDPKRGTLLFCLFVFFFSLESCSLLLGLLCSCLRGRLPTSISSPKADGSSWIAPLLSSHFSCTCASLYSPSCQDASKSAFSSPSFSCVFSVGGLTGLELSSAPMRSFCSSNLALNKSCFSALSVKLQFSALLGYMNTAPI